MVSQQKCIAAIRNASKDEDGDAVISKEAAKKIITDIETMHKSMKNKVPEPELDAALRQLVEGELAKERIARIRAKAEAYRVIVAKQKWTKHVDQFPSTSRGFQSMLAGSPYAVAGRDVSASSLKRGVQREFLATAVFEEESLGLTPFMKESANDLDLYREAYEPGSTGNPQAKEAMEFMKRHSDNAWARANRAGASIGYDPRFLFHSIWDRTKVNRVGIDEFIADATAAFDIPKMRNLLGTVDDTPEGVRSLLAGIRNALATGVHLSPPGQSGRISDLVGYKGPSNIAKLMSNEKVIHFTSAEKEFAFRKKYSEGTLREQFYSGLERAGAKTGLMEHFTTNPGQFLETMRVDLVNRERRFFDAAVSRGDKAKAEFHNREISRLEGADPGQVVGAELSIKAFRDLGDRISEGRGISPEDRDLFTFQLRPQDLIDVVTGAADIPISPVASHMSRLIRDFNSASLLTGSVLTSLSDFGNRMARLEANGITGFSEIKSSIESSLRGLSREDAVKVARLSMSDMEIIMMNTASGRYGIPGETPAGGISKYLMTAFRWTGLSDFTNIMKKGTTTRLSLWLGMNKELGFDKLDRGLNRELSAAGITGEDWNLIREHAFDDFGEDSFINTTAVDKVPREKILGSVGGEAAIRKRIKTNVHAAAKKRAGVKTLAELDKDTLEKINKRVDKLVDDEEKKARDNLRTKLNTYFIEQESAAIVTPGDLERTFITRGTQAGTVMGEATKLVGQFKAYGLGVIESIVNRQLHGTGGAPDMVGLTRLMAVLTMYGYTTMVLKDIIKNRTPRRLDDPRTYFAALMVGGGFGIYGDFLFGEFTRHGRSLSGTLLGPTLGSGLDLAGDISTKLKTGQFDKAGATIVNETLNRAPGLNNLMIKGALDVMFFNSLREVVSPGFLRRQEQFQREQGQEPLFNF